MPEKLAIDGGTPVRTAPMPPWPSPSEAQIAAVDSVLRSGHINYWTGDEGRSLEREYAAALGLPHAVAVANGTLALELALRALGVGPGDEVVIPARSFIATASCAVAVGATPVIADIDPESGNLTTETVAAVVSDRTAAVIAVHLGGWPVEMDPLLALAAEHGFRVIEDCAQSNGATYRGHPVGSLGDASCFSFCQDKIVAAGEGGLVAFRDETAYRRAWEYKDHGKSFAKFCDPAFLEQRASFKWVHDSFGSNFRMPELEAAMARVGLRELSAAHARRARLAHWLVTGLKDVRGLRIPLPPQHAEHAFYRLYAAVQPSELAPDWDRDRILFAINAEGTPVQYGSCAELYREGAFASAGLGPAERLPGAARAHETTLAFYVHPTLTGADIDDVVAAVRKVMGVAAR